MLVLYVLIGLFDIWVGPVPLDLAGLATRAQLDGMASCGGPVGADKTADSADFWAFLFWNRQSTTSSDTANFII